MCLLFNMLPRFAIAFLPRSKCVFISWLQSQSTVILEPKKRRGTKELLDEPTVSVVYLFICHEVMGLDTMSLVFWMLSFKPAFSLSSFTFIKKLFSSSSFSAIMVVSSAYLRIANGPARMQIKYSRARSHLLYVTWRQYSYALIIWARYPKNHPPPPPHPHSVSADLDW